MDVVALRVENVAPSGYAVDRATVRQKKTGQPVIFELTEQNRQAVDDYLGATGKKPGEFLFAGQRGPGQSITTRQYARLVSEWIASIGLDPHHFGTHSLRRTNAALIYRRTGNLRAVQLLLGHTKIESTVRYLGIEKFFSNHRAAVRGRRFQRQSCSSSAKITQRTTHRCLDSGLHRERSGWHQAATLWP